jgi:hypothetical protein
MKRATKKMIAWVVGGAVVLGAIGYGIYAYANRQQ